jgi:hypothetical protein
LTYDQGKPNKWIKSNQNPLANNNCWNSDLNTILKDN